MNPKQNFKQSGFSLIELMVAITVLGIGLALAMPNYRTWIQNTQIRNAAESIQHGMQRARAEAVSRNTNVAFTLGAGAFWTVTDLSTGAVIESRPGVEVSPNITLVTLPNPLPPAIVTSTITFSNLGAVTPNTDAPVTASIIQIDIDSTALPAADSRELRITAGVGGVIRMCDPNPGIAVGDPRRC